MGRRRTKAERYGEQELRGYKQWRAPFTIQVYKWGIKHVKEQIEHLLQYPGGDIGGSQNNDLVPIINELMFLLSPDGAKTLMDEESGEHFMQYGLQNTALLINAGSMLAAALSAQLQGCDSGQVNITTNDGDLWGSFWSVEKKVYIQAGGLIYYGTP